MAHRFHRLERAATWQSGSLTDENDAPEKGVATKPSCINAPQVLTLIPNARTRCGAPPYIYAPIAPSLGFYLGHSRSVTPSGCIASNLKLLKNSNAFLGIGVCAKQAFYKRKHAKVHLIRMNNEQLRHILAVYMV